MNKQYVQHTLNSLNTVVIKAEIHYKQLALSINVSELRPEIKPDLQSNPHNEVSRFTQEG